MVYSLGQQLGAHLECYTFFIKTRLAVASYENSGVYTLHPPAYHLRAFRSHVHLSKHVKDEKSKYYRRNQVARAQVEKLVNAHDGTPQYCRGNSSDFSGIGNLDASFDYHQKPKEKQQMKIMDKTRYEVALEVLQELQQSRVDAMSHAAERSNPSQFDSPFDQIRHANRLVNFTRYDMRAHRQLNDAIKLVKMELPNEGI